MAGARGTDARQNLVERQRPFADVAFPLALFQCTQVVLPSCAAALIAPDIAHDRRDPAHRRQSLLRRTGLAPSPCRRSDASSPSISCRASNAASPSTTPKSRRSRTILPEPTFDNTIEALERSGRRSTCERSCSGSLAERPHQRCAAWHSSARFRRAARATGTASTQRAAVPAGSTRFTAAAASSASRPSRRACSNATISMSSAPAPRSMPRQEAARRDQRAARHARHRVQPERARRRAGLHARRSRPRTDLAGLPDFVRAAARAAGERARHGGQARHHAVALERRAVPAILRAPRPARESLPRLDRARRQRRHDRQQGDHRRDGRAARRAREAPRLCELRALPARRRHGEDAGRRARPARSRLGAGARRARSPTATPCRRWSQAEGGNFKLAPWDWRYYAEKLRKARCDLDEATIKPYLQLDHIIEAAFYTANRLFGLPFEPRNGRAGLASRRARVGGARRRRRPSRPVLRRLFRAPLEAQRRLDDHAARPGEARRRRPAAGRQRDEFHQGRRRRADAAAASTTRARCSTNSATRCTGFCPT